MFRFGDYKNEENLIATMIHPFFKKSYVQQYFPDVNITFIENKILMMMTTENAQEEQIEEKRKSQIFDYYHRRLSSIDADQNNSSEISNSAVLQTYFQERRAVSPSVISSKAIQNVFRKYNTCLLASSPSEQLFSMCKHIMTPQRSQISDKNFEESVKLKTNFHFKSDQNK